VLPQNRVSDSTYLARFHFEAEAAAALDHSNIVRVYDLDNDGRIHYLVMEYTEGTDLDALVSQHGPLDFHAAADYVAQTATGLAHAHECGLIHRDIKPANLLVDLKGTVKILDMGLAKFTAETRPAPDFAQEEHVLGTADYLAPEQAVNSQTVDHRADIYALGCTFYFLLTGHPPFAEGTSLERMTAQQHRAAPSILAERPDAPPELVAICRRMMDKLPANRYQTAAEVEQALAAWLAGEAAFGRVPRGLHLARAGSLANLDTRIRGRSHTDLVSGSASDLREPPPEPPTGTRDLFSPLQDTDPNLHRATIKIPKHPVDPR
jgi:eukaryotic-like serine/threonine-protein kinase